VGVTSEDKKPQYARLKAQQSIETITLKEALDLFKLPRVLGEFEGKEVKANIGRFGPYVQHDGKFVSLPKGTDPYEVNLDEAEALILAKRESDANKFIAEFPEQDIQVILGRFGAYIKKGKENYKIPKGTEAKHLTLEDCLSIISEADKAPKKTKRGKKTK
jgi:DNA topoisomerase-1